MKLTGLRLCALRMLDATVHVHAQQFAYQLVKSRNWTAQGATRWGAGYMAPLVKAGYAIKLRGEERFNTYRITQDGRRALAEAVRANVHAADIESAMFFGKP